MPAWGTFCFSGTQGQSRIVKDRQGRRTNCYWPGMGFLSGGAQHSPCAHADGGSSSAGEWHSATFESPPSGWSRGCRKSASTDFGSCRLNDVDVTAISPLSGLHVDRPAMSGSRNSRFAGRGSRPWFLGESPQIGVPTTPMGSDVWRERHLAGRSAVQYVPGLTALGPAGDDLRQPSGDFRLPIRRPVLRSKLDDSGGWQAGGLHSPRVEADTRPPGSTCSIGPSSGGRIHLLEHGAGW